MQAFEATSYEHVTPCEHMPIKHTLAKGGNHGAVKVETLKMQTGPGAYEF
jgi:hypothetical protein